MLNGCWKEEGRVCIEGVPERGEGSKVGVV